MNVESIKVKLSDIVDFNPKRELEKGTYANFIEMSSLPPNTRDINCVERKEYLGSGTKFKNGDILFARITPCLENGKTAKVKGLCENEVAFGSTEFIIMAAKEPEYDEDFIYYITRLKEFRKYAESRMEGASGRQRVSWQALAEFEIEIPEKNLRKKIGELLAKLDDKIDINNNIIQTIEELAQIFFKSWCVDFEPVKAKINTNTNGRNPEDTAMCVISGKAKDELEHLPPDQLKQLSKLASLFPNEMEKKELGVIPKGWDIKSLNYIAQFLNGLAMQKYPPIGDKYLNVIKIRELNAGITPITDKASTDIPKEYIVENGDILFSWSGSLDVVIWNSGTGALNQHLFKVTPNNYPKWFCYYWIKHHMENFRQIASSKATTMGHIKRDELNKAMVLVPDELLLTMMNNIISPLFNKQLDCHLQNNTLKELRDTLLPNLLTGANSLLKQ